MARLVQAPRHDGIDPSIPVDRTSITRRAGSVQIDDGVDPVRSLLYRKYSTWPCVVVVGNEMLSVLKKKSAAGSFCSCSLALGCRGPRCGDLAGAFQCLFLEAWLEARAVGGVGVGVDEWFA